MKDSDSAHLHTLSISKYSLNILTVVNLVTHYLIILNGNKFKATPKLILLPQMKNHPKIILYFTPKIFFLPKIRSYIFNV